MKKKIFCDKKLSKLFTALLLSFVLISCSGNGSSNDKDKDDCPTDEPRCEARQNNF